MHTTPHRSPSNQTSQPVSPYPERARRTPDRLISSPPQVTSPVTPAATTGSAASTPQAQDDGPAAVIRSDPLQMTLAFDHEEPEEDVLPALYRLLVRPIVKPTVGKRDSHGTTLTDVFVTGNSFEEILQKLWTRFHSRIRGRAIRDDDGNWSVQAHEQADWQSVMQFKWNKKPVDPQKGGNTRTEHEWRKWLVKRHGQVVLLQLFEYGMAIQTQQQYDEFTAACIRPELTDRAGATAERSLREVVADLQAHWRTVFRCELVVWRMWANHITRNLNRSTWDTAISQPPPSYISQLLLPARSHLQQHLESVTRSASLALEMLDATIAEYGQLHREWEALERCFQMTEQSLATRRTIVEAFIRNLVPLHTAP